MTAARAIHRPREERQDSCCSSIGELHCLGAALVRDAPEISTGLVSPGRSSQLLDPELARSFARLAEVWTLAVAAWISGASEDAAREAGQECLRIFSELATRRLASVDQILRFCLQWRDACADAVAAEALHRRLSRDASISAQRMLQRSLDVTAVRLCECFEAERHRTDEALRFQATHDQVTGLPNRTLMVTRTAEVLERAQRERSTMALLFIDLDNFKVVNDTLGHPAGDEMLRSVTGRLRELAPEPENLARFGGDEFVMILEDVACAEVAERAAQRVLAAFAEPFMLAQGSARLGVSASVGVALSDSATVDALLRDADIAMYRAKREGKNRYHVTASRS